MSTATRRLALTGRHARLYSSASPAVALSYEHHPKPSRESIKKEPLVVLHGLFGSKQNWRSLGKSLAKQLERDVYCLDLRNHGESPHDADCSYTAYAGDVTSFLDSQNLSSIFLAGHSMGGKVAMTVALAPESQDRIKRLVVIDMSPATGKISPEFARYIEAMQEIESIGVEDKHQADQILQKYEESLPIRQFLLTNLNRPTSRDSRDPLRFRIPVDVLSKSLNAIGEFPFEEGKAVFKEPALFVKGELSKYLNRKSIAVAREYFPEMQLETVTGAGHWVHSEKPSEFMQLMREFCA
ncbi:uncharacterized protein L969DRAFT_98858 [Mixia osmundae IAM 14324]|uniref:AB hydrolase-1 domain-containing protein n=1 Tax=Mixia osmundae (strain CBS 9802 / IAM 14324 / JCM 22182 / KY 12970) TaxID=764103 RepID=G7EA05_MIXOS|nr:uncharacterized protein L969DRAFT_98858 [Mixia osmundae IAM 14324]KEI40352.1 hypothetical protein L969DRAFT_98858 [Mixia osmundae IAM 14324]GAA99665.1 hypothetical protein E5Q_06368 [Mixia osmundae IAM 14324]